jgi:hypothetical protein
MKYIIAFVLAALPIPVKAACPAALAIYNNVEDDQFSLAFSKQQSPKAWSDIEISITGPNTNLLYELTASNGYSRSYLVPLPPQPSDESNPGANIVFFGKDLKVQDLPQSSQPAPEYIFSADLGVQLYYSTNSAEKPIVLPTGMWKLSGCAE